jgi:siroheme synthase-like protein
MSGSSSSEPARILVNVSDKPDSCDFIMPAVVDRSPLLVAIASGGTSPRVGLFEETHHSNARLH